MLVFFYIAGYQTLTAELIRELYLMSPDNRIAPYHYITTIRGNQYVYVQIYMKTF